jgi:hypothetical protein
MPEAYYARYQQQRHRALLIGIGARQRIAVAVHRRLLLLPFNLDTAQPSQQVAGGRASRVVQLDGRAPIGITEAAKHPPLERPHRAVLGA